MISFFLDYLPDFQPFTDPPMVPGAQGPRHQDFEQRGQALLPELSLPRPGLHGKNGENDDEA